MICDTVRQLLQEVPAVARRPVHVKGVAVSTDYWSFVFPAARAVRPAAPKTVDELGELLGADTLPRTLQLTARNDLTLTHLLAIADVAGTGGLAFLGTPFAVLGASETVATMEAIDSLLSMLRTQPQLALHPFVTRYVDGTLHQPYEESQVIEALDASFACSPPDVISSEDCSFLWDVFAYLKSLRQLLERAQRSGEDVVFARVNELYEQTSSVEPQGTVS